jgi:hypothetical protein
MGVVARTRVPGHSGLQRRLRHRLARGLMPDRIPIEPRHPCARGWVSLHHALDHKLTRGAIGLSIVAVEEQGQPLGQGKALADEILANCWTRHFLLDAPLRGLGSGGRQGSGSVAHAHPPKLHRHPRGVRLAEDVLFAGRSGRRLHRDGGPLFTPGDLTDWHRGPGTHATPSGEPPQPRHGSSPRNKKAARTDAARRLWVRGVAGIVTNAPAVIRAACDAF